VQRKTKGVDLLERRNDPHYARLLDRPDSWFKHPSVSCGSEPFRYRYRRIFAIPIKIIV